jgi:hypothetical protein
MLIVQRSVGGGARSLRRQFRQPEVQNLHPAVARYQNIAGRGKKSFSKAIYAVGLHHMW